MSTSTLIPCSSIPIIDFSKLAGQYGSQLDSNFQKVAKEFGDAIVSIGFVYIVNHGVDMSKVSHINELSSKFFNLPKEVKLKYQIQNPVQSYHGYQGPGFQQLNLETSSDFKETFEVWGQEQYREDKFPSEVPGWKGAFDSIRPECYNLMKKIFHCMSIYLGLEDEQFFLQHHKFLDIPSVETESEFRTLYYQPLNDDGNNLPENAVRLGEHCDWGSITLLFQDMVGGLEVQRTDGTWVHATPIKDTVLINMGQLMEVWTAGIFPATPHRVRVLKNEEWMKIPRQSLVYFVHPDNAADVKPVVQFPPGKEQFKNVIKNAGEHYMIQMTSSHPGY